MEPAGVKSGRVMIVDDDPKVLVAHAKLVKGMGHEVETAADGVEALAKLALGVDLVLLDGEMPHMDGFEVARQIRSTPPHDAVPIIMVTGLVDPRMRRRALEVGINDFLTKPVDVDELVLRSRWLLQLKHAHDRLENQKDELQRLVDERTRALRDALDRSSSAERRVYDAHLDTIHRLAVAAEFKDRDTAGHIERVGLFSAVLAAALGLEPGVVETIRHAAPMHDVGKIGIPDEILLKPGSLNEAEWAVMRKHPVLGARLLDGSGSEVMQVGARIARGHHERWDGAGYPAGLTGQDIPVEARICSVADFFDAVTTARPYRPALPVEYALEKIRSDGATRFDPEVREAFLRSVAEIVEIKSELARRATKRRGRFPSSLDEIE